MNLKNIIVVVGSLLIGVVFIGSAWFKLSPIEPFEYKIVDSTFFGWLPSVFVARLVIGLEFGIGILLCFSYKLKTSLKLAIVALTVFSIHLVFVLLLQGNESDCGCMGSLMSLTPLQGLIKNLVLLVLCFLLYRSAFNFEFKTPHLIYYVFLLSLSLVFIVNPVDLGYSEKYLNKPFEDFHLSLDSVYSSRNREKVEKPPVDIRQQKVILAFVSSSCPHCKIAAQKIAVIHRKNPQIPFYFFINGEEADIRDFMKRTETEDIPHSKLNGQLFIETAGLNLPVIYYYNKGIVEMQVDYYTLEQYHIEQWLENVSKVSFKF